MAKLIIKVLPDQRVEVNVEGLGEKDRPKARGEKVCEQITRRLEQELGSVERREYEGDKQQLNTVAEDDAVRLGGS